jgi:Fe-S-cluster containining protein
VTSLESLDQRLIQIVDAAAAEAVRRAGSDSRCRPGCFHCCIGPFPITTVDAHRLARGLSDAPAALSQRILSRAAEARAAMETHFPGDPRTGIIPAENEAYDASFAGLPCPVLDLETGRCQLYEYRPTACRLHGLPMRVSGRNLVPCRLNTSGVPADEIERRRVTVDLSPAGQSLVSEYERTGWPTGLTYIAWAFSLQLGV